jgi:CubicO group peptidase (beta-lactamase class C family)
MMRYRNHFRHTLLLLSISLAWFTGCSQPHIRDTNYHYSKPDQLADGLAVDNIANAAMDSNNIIELTKLILKDSFPNIHSVLIARNNKLIYENYFSGKDENWGSGLGYAKHGTDILHDTRSISKSVVAACIDIAIQQQKIKSIDEPIFNYLPAYQEYKTTLNEKISIRQLITMSSDILWDEDVPHGTSANDETQMERSSNPVEYVLSRPMKTTAETVWKYNSGGVQILAEIIKSVSGDNVDKFAEKYLFEPLGIKKYKWTRSHRKFPAAASGLRLTSRDLLKFGMLYLNKGQWNGRQFITENWVTETLKTQVYRNPNSTAKGYSFLFWTETDTAANRAFELIIARGNGGQRIFLNKAFNLVVVVTAGNYNKTGIVNDGQLALVKYILPALR